MKNKNINSKIKQITAIRSKVFRCTRGHWYCRIPAFADLDKGDNCEICGVTSFSEQEGRPYGPRSKKWPSLIEELNDMANLGMFNKNSTFNIEEFAIISDSKK